MGSRDRERRRAKRKARSSHGRARAAGSSAGFVEATWEDGWQPLGVHRMVIRRAGQRHARLAVDAIAAQMRRYAAATVDERWTTQLRSLDAGVWWERDDEWLDRWGERAGRDRAEILADAVVPLGVLHAMPRIETLCPPPGTGRGGLSTAGHGADTRILDKVRGLLAKAGSTGFAEEAEALTAKARQLMARHSIDEALLAAKRDTRVKPGAGGSASTTPTRTAPVRSTDRGEHSPST